MRYIALQLSYLVVATAVAAAQSDVEVDNDDCEGGFCPNSKDSSVGGGGHLVHRDWPLYRQLTQHHHRPRCWYLAF